MSDEKTSPPATTPAVSSPRQRTTVYLACGLLVSYAVILLVVDTPKLSLPARIAFAAGNLIAAAVLWLLARQSNVKN